MKSGVTVINQKQKRIAALDNYLQIAELSPLHKFVIEQMLYKTDSELKGLICLEEEILNQRSS